MYILQVLPIATGLPENYFSYFSKDLIKLGALVEIRIRNRKIFGIVSQATHAKYEKMSLKSQSFILKKIERIVCEDFMSQETIISIKNISVLLGARESDILENLIPKFIFESPFLFAKNNTKQENISYKNKAVILPIQERINLYKQNIKKDLKNKKSVVIFFPTINDIENMRDFLEKDFEENFICFHSDQNKKEQAKNIEKLNENENFLILSTTSLLPFVLKDKINLQTVIIEKENSYNYFSHSSKKQIDNREILKNLANDLNLNLILGGEILSLETFKKLANKISEPEEKHNNIKIIDMTKDKEIKKISKKNPLKYSNVYFSQELIDKLEAFKENKTGKIFLYTKRKGLHSETICRDCNTILKCETCDKPLILFKKKENDSREYVCTKCKTKKEIKKEDELLCKKCGGWRMETIGIGVEGIEENLKEVGWKTFVLDSQNAKTKKKVREIIDAWQEEKLSILIGTDLALSFFQSQMKIDLAAMISIDTLFSIPEINIDEKIINLILEIKEKCNTKEKIIIQTRLPKSNIWKYVKENDYHKFLENELVMRKELSLPPFSNILKFKLTKKDIQIKDRLEGLVEKICKEENLEIQKISWWKESVTGNYVGMIIIKKELWELVEDNKIYPTNFAKKMTGLLDDFRLEVNPVNVYQ